ncbi:SRPBCC family protein [Meridianimarinicoccus sp. MJW13]|uniref:SRPBCC family protein n=1 Tax=Meridianimarinicoccus sp. MJW13 TaxID=2720031 RepID=UPI0018661D74|nr:SRPBCC family protein [Fluviibacterium sp. MJW13]
MTWMIRALAGLAALVAILALAAFALPHQISVSRSITIDAPPERVFPHLDSHTATAEWSPWIARNPDAQVIFEGPEAGIGARMSWISDNPTLGDGVQVITSITDNRWVARSMEFGDWELATASFLLDPDGTGTRVTWSFSTDAGFNPVSRWMGLVVDDWVADELDQGLSRLKRLVETGSPD